MTFTSTRPPCASIAIFGFSRRSEELFDPPVELGFADPDGMKHLACRSRSADRSAGSATASAARRASAASRAARPACRRRTSRPPAGDEARSRAVRIGMHERPRGKDRLAPIVVGHRPAELAKALVQRRERRLVELQRVADGRATASFVRSSTVGPSPPVVIDAVGAVEHASSICAPGVRRCRRRSAWRRRRRRDRQASRRRGPSSCRSRSSEQQLGTDRDDLNGSHQPVPRSSRNQRGYAPDAARRSLRLPRASLRGAAAASPANSARTWRRCSRQARSGSARTSRPAPPAGRSFRIAPTRGATPPVEIAIRAGPAFTIACIATKP